SSHFFFFFFLFFFSSRRRHTRFSRDWSSDVCSSDLAMSRELVIYSDESISKGSRFSDFYGGLLVESTHLQRVIDDLESCREHLRSEERRVGKECRSRWSRED